MYELDDLRRRVDDVEAELRARQDDFAFELREDVRQLRRDFTFFDQRLTEFLHRADAAESQA